jgi:hypothetical protein
LRLRNQIAETKAERMLLKQREQELQQQLEKQHSLDTEKAKELARIRERLAKLEQQLVASGENKEVQQNDVRLIAFELSPPTRGTRKAPTLVIPAGTNSLTLTLALEPNDSTAFQVMLKNLSTNKILWKS